MATVSRFLVVCGLYKKELERKLDGSYTRMQQFRKCLDEENN